ncbi:axin-2 isoform X2 [Leucoraja erinacea]|nr:axin-2 isoform X2 [Leucoraja erinacea]
MSAAALVSAFRADAPRPPVPGEEGERCQLQLQPQPLPHAKGQGPKGQAGRREDDEMGQPEGSDSPLSRWTKSLHSLLGDQDGAHLFRAFLEREQRVDALDFWFACNGFRQMDMSDHKSLRVARAIHKRYVESSAVAGQLKAATRSYIKDTIRKQQIDSAMFDQAQTEVQTLMEDNCYQMFLASDIYLQYVRSGGENPLYVGTTSPLGPLQLVCGYLPTLNEEEEWVCPQLRPKELSAAGHPPPVTETGPSKCSRSYGRNGYANPYHVQPGYVFAPASSANDSDVMTDDSLSMTDSSVDGVPPYRHKKQQQRDMHRSVKANGQVTLPHFPRTHRLPKEMTPVEPAAFAAQLIARLERVKRERDTVDCLEVRLEQIKEDEGEEGEVPAGEGQTEPGPQHPPLSLLPPGTCDEDPQAILDDHLSRVLKTPGCQSPGLERRTAALASPGTARRGCPTSANPSARHVHHHYVHHHTVPKTTQQIEAEAAQWVHCLCPGRADCCSFAKSRGHAKPEPPPLPLQTLPFSARVSVTRRSQTVAETVGTGDGEGAVPIPTPQLPGDEPDRAQHVWQWVLESERPASKHRTHSVQCVKKGLVSDGARGAALERNSRQHLGSAHPRGNTLPSHPFVQDPAMPPLPPPNTLAQLEEARRRLEEERKVSKTPKQRYSTSSLQRDRSHTVAAQGGSVSVSTSGPVASPADEHKAPRKPPAPAHPAVPTELVVTYFFCGEDIPYRRMMKGHSLTLAHFKEQLSKKGSYRYYFKRASNEFDCGAVFEEVRNDTSPLPMYEGKILGKVERID